MYKSFFQLAIILIFLLLTFIQSYKQTRHHKLHTSVDPRKICISLDQTIKAHHKSCFLRPDTGPCRADIIQWYYDVRQGKCYRFYWGGCQGNGNRFETQKACTDYCWLNISYSHTRVPFYCSLAFEYGNCFGYFNRWAWDTLTKTCRRKLYSGCGGNQNNFQSQAECMNRCMKPPNNTLSKANSITTCIPLQ